MGILGDKDWLVGAALGASGAFDKKKKTDKAAAFGAALGAAIGSGKDWTLEDSVKLGATIRALDSIKENHTTIGSSSYRNNNSSSNHEYDDLILSSDQEEELEEAGIDRFDFNFMDDDEKREALEEAGLDPFDFDMF